MKTNFIYLLACVFGLGIFTSCSDDDNGGKGDLTPDGVTPTEVMTNYSAIALANYQDALNDAKSLRTAINVFVEDPTQENMDATKTAWKVSRESYGQSEAFRFSEGPIDDKGSNAKSPEERINSWPLDEAYVDYVEGNANSGIINNQDEFPDLSKDVLIEQLGANGEEDVTLGYHAIEFLLWGQDLTAPVENLPGQRLYTDFVDGGTAMNQDRRRQYLSFAADILVEDLQEVVDQWAGPYKTEFMNQNSDIALNSVIDALAELSSSELAIERMGVAVSTQNQEDEHSCFSDNTNRDIRLNLQGVVNVYKGKYTTIDGASIEDLIEQANPDLATELDNLLTTAVAKVDATKNPFDLAISGGPDSVEGAKVMEAVQALRAYGNKLVEAKLALDL